MLVLGEIVLATLSYHPKPYTRPASFLSAYEYMIQAVHAVASLSLALRVPVQGSGPWLSQTSFCHLRGGDSQEIPSQRFLILSAPIST